VDNEVGPATALQDWRRLLSRFVGAFDRWNDGRQEELHKKLAKEQ